MTWSPERKAKQSQAIRQWQPWSKSTGPTTPQGKARVCKNAWKGGLRPEFREITRQIREGLAESQKLLNWMNET